MENNKINFFSYKGRPLVRKNNVFYYGNMTDEVVAQLTVESSFKFKGVDISDRVELKLILTDPEIDLKNMIVKQSVRKGLFDALDIATIWIDRFTKQSMK